ncbi:MAG: hypothetical protein JWN73_4196 [Betaproteobacteria bacterium]|nr:hypothetical protein [Betaproteobacteria bacterium]
MSDDLRTPCETFEEERARGRELARLLVEHLIGMQSDDFHFTTGGYEVSVIPLNQAIREVDTTEYDESNAGEGPD